MFNTIRLKSSNYYNEIVSHFRLLSVNNKRVHEYFSSPYRIILIILFAILFLPHAFVVVKDINFVIAYEVDPGSIIHSIMSLYKNSYDMSAAYHSRYYGWTYYSITFFLLMPLYIAQSLNIIAGDNFFFIGIRLVFFMIGLTSVLVFFEVAYRILRHLLLSFIAVLLFIASPVVFSYFYVLHPESTGVLFLLLGTLCLLNFNDGKAKDYRWYTLGLFCLVLSSLSKQVFFVIALPVLFLFYYSYCYHHNISIFKFAFTRQFAKIFLLTAVLAIILFFIINPFAFIKPRVFIFNQLTLFTTQTSGSISRMEAIMTWIEKIKMIPVIYASMILAPFSLLGAIILGRNQKDKNMFYIVTLVVSVFYVVLISISARYIIQSIYFLPIYPFFILNLLVIALFIVRKWNTTAIKLMVMIPLAFFLIYVLVVDFSTTIPKGYARLMYQDSYIYKVYSYVGNTIPSGSRIAHDHLVAIPSDKGLIACHYWQGCYNDDSLENFQPDYVIFSENWKFHGESQPDTQRLIKYVCDHHFILIDTISHEGDDYSISVWKKPEK